MDTQSLAWAAGVVDCDGSIFIAGKGSGRFALGVNAGNTDPRLPEAMKAVAGYGILTSGKRKPVSPAQRTLYLWIIQGAQAETFLKRILPYLVIKREQAELALSFRRVQKQLKHRHREPWERALLQRFQDFMRALHHRRRF